MKEKTKKQKETASYKVGYFIGSLFALILTSCIILGSFWLLLKIIKGIIGLF
jgi:hypothetical protein